MYFLGEIKTNLLLSTDLPNKFLSQFSKMNLRYYHNSINSNQNQIHPLKINFQFNLYLIYNFLYYLNFTRNNFFYIIWYVYKFYLFFLLRGFYFS